MRSTYADTATATLIEDKLKNVVIGRDANVHPGSWDAMVRSIRNLGRPGICSMAISAIDTALWNLQARLLDLPLVRLFRQMRETLPIYGSGGFTSYSVEELCAQLRDWVAEPSCAAVFRDELTELFPQDQNARRFPCSSQ